MPDIHLKFGGSTARRTLNCPAWVNLAEDAPKLNRTSAAAERGTMLHDIMESIYDRDVHLDEAVKGLNDEDAEAIRKASAALEQMMNAKQADDYICEEMVVLADRDDVGGSADMIACSDTQVLIIDYKFGYQPVKDRSQFLLYGMCGEESPEVADMFEGRELVSAIIQPAVSDLPLVRVHEQEERDTFRKDFIAAVETADTGTRDGNAGEWCTFCPAEPYCEAKRKQLHGFMEKDVEDLPQLAEALSLVDQAKAFIKAVETEAFRALEQGSTVPGFKLVQKKSRRYWTDEEQVMHVLRYAKSVKREQYVDEKLKSVAQVEKSVAGKTWEKLSALVDNRSSGTTIAPADDPREAVTTRVGEIPEALDNIIEGN